MEFVGQVKADCVAGNHLQKKPNSSNLGGGVLLRRMVEANFEEAGDAKLSDDELLSDIFVRIFSFSLSTKSNLILNPETGFLHRWSR